MIWWNFVALSVTLMAAGVLLLARLMSARRQAARLLRDNGVDSLGRELSQAIGNAIDRTLLSQANGGGLADVAMPFREAQDRCRNLDELLQQLARELPATKFAEVNQLIKSVFQLQATLQIPPDELESCLQILEQRLKSDTAMSPRVASVEFIQPGSMLDLGKMIPLNSGTSVKQPLGIVTLDKTGRVLGKARVICQ